MFYLITLLFISCSSGRPLTPLPEPEDSGQFFRQFSAYSAVLAVEVANADSRVDEREREYIFQMLGRSFDPIRFCTMNDTERLNLIGHAKEWVVKANPSATEAARAYSKVRVIDALEQTLRDLAMKDEEFHPAEEAHIKLRIDEARRAQKDGSLISLEEAQLLELPWKRAEVPFVLENLRNINLQTQSAGVSLKAHPIYPEIGKGELRKWPEKTEEGTETLKITAFYVRGSYGMDVTEDGFRLTGIIDVDGDGVQATYIATDKSDPKRTTAEDVY